MITTLQFSDDEKDEAIRAQCAMDYIAALDEIKNRVRGWWKHGHTFDTADDAIDAIYELICNEIAECPHID